MIARLCAGAAADRSGDRVCCIRAGRERHCSGKTGRRTRVKDTAYECGMVPQGEAAAAFQREVLPRGDALHPVRSRDRVHVSVGGRLQGSDRRKAKRSSGAC